MEEIKVVKPFKPLQRKVKDVSLIKKLKSLAHTAKKHYISHYLFQTGDGELKTHFNDVCYARFTTDYDRDTGIIKARVYMNQWDYYFKTPKEVKLYKKYIDWVVNKSPWKDAFLNGKGNYFKDGLAINCNHPAQYVVGAMTAIREPLEHKHQPALFDLLCKKGISPELSHMVSGQSSSIDCVGGRGSGHCVFHSSIGIEAVKAFKKGEHKYKDKPPLCKKASSYAGIQQLFPLDPKETLSIILSKYGKIIDEGWYKRHKIDWNDPAVIEKLKEIDNA